MNQFQCPNCGGYKVHDEKSDQSINTGKKVKGNKFGVFLLSVVIMLIALSQVLPSREGIQTKDGTTIATIFGGAFLLVVVIFWLSTSKQERELAQSVKVHDLYCNLCGYRWQWTEGDPYPPVQVQPDLIAKGEQRLEEQAKQAQRDAEGAFWLNQQRNKK